MKKGSFIYVFALASVACVWLGACSNSLDGSDPDNSGHTILFQGIKDPTTVDDITVLIFDGSHTLTNIVKGGPTLLDDNRITVRNDNGGSVYFAALNTASSYRIKPDKLIPGSTRAEDISFERIESRSSDGPTGALCGSSAKGDTNTRIALSPMTGITVTINGWIVREVIPDFK